MGAEVSAPEDSDSGDVTPKTTTAPAVKARGRGSARAPSMAHLGPPVRAVHSARAYRAIPPRRAVGSRPSTRHPPQRSAPVKALQRLAVSTQRPAISTGVRSKQLPVRRPSQPAAPPATDTDAGGFTTDPGADTDTGAAAVQATQPGAAFLDAAAMSAMRRAGEVRDFSSDVAAGLRMSLRLGSAGVNPAAQSLLMQNAVVIKTSDAGMVAAETMVAACTPPGQDSPFVGCVQMRAAIGSTYGVDVDKLVYMEGIVTSSECPRFVAAGPWLLHVETGNVLDCARVRCGATPPAHTLVYTGVPIALTQDLVADPGFAQGGALGCVVGGPE